MGCAASKPPSQDETASKSSSSSSSRKPGKSERKKTRTVRGKKVVPHTIAIVGAPGAGKSTVKNQMCLVYRGDFTDEERASYALEIGEHANVALDKLKEGWKLLSTWTRATRNTDTDMDVKNFFDRTSDDIKLIVARNKLVVARNKCVDAAPGMTFVPSSSSNFGKLEDGDDCASKAEEKATKGKVNLTKDEKDIAKAEEEAIKAKERAYEEALEHLDGFNESPEYDTVKKTLQIYITPPDEYVFDNLHRMLSPLYVPTDADILNVRLPTKGYTKTLVEFKDTPFVIVDVGGEEEFQETWAKDVIEEGEKVNAIFVLSCADLECKARSPTAKAPTRYLESLVSLRKFLGNEKLQQHTNNVFVFVNKIDKLFDTFSLSSFKETFPGFAGADAGDALDHFQEQIRGVTGKYEATTVSFFRTCAISTKAASEGNIAGVLKEVRNLVIRGNFEEMGFMGV